MTLRFRLSASQVVDPTGARRSRLRGRPAGNNGVWEPLPTLLDPRRPGVGHPRRAGHRLRQRPRFATYGPLAPLNRAPAIAAVYPAPRRVVRGRNLIVGAGVGDDEALGTGVLPRSHRRPPPGGVSLSDGVVRFRVG